MAGASRLRSRAESEWNVEIHIREQSAREQRRYARPHLLRGLVGERHGQHAVGGRKARGDDVRDAVGDDTGLARSGTRQDQHGAIGLQHGLALLGIES